jgi:Double zinc ribbon
MPPNPEWRRAKKIRDRLARGVKVAKKDQLWLAEYDAAKGQQKEMPAAKAPAPGAAGRSAAPAVPRSSGNGSKPSPSRAEREEAPPLASLTPAVCPSCKRPYVDGAAFCAGCGGNLRANICANKQCNAPLRDTDKFCELCGKARAGEMPTAAQAPDEKKKPEPAAAKAEAEEKKPAPKPEPERRPPFNPVGIKLWYNAISTELARLGASECTEEEKKACADDMAELLNFYVELDPKYAVIVRAATTHIGVFAPKLMVMVILERRKQAALEKEAQKKKSLPKPEATQQQEAVH